MSWGNFAIFLKKVIKFVIDLYCSSWGIRKSGHINDPNYKSQRIMSHRGEDTYIVF